jgi:c-di-GMP-related signal transduction protein
MFERFISRHAILKENLALLGYDLHFRTGDPAGTGDSLPSAAYTIDAATMLFSWQSLVGDRLAFFAFGIQELLGGAALLLPRAKAVIRIPLAVPCNADVILACQELKNAGYRLSVAGWAGQHERRPLAALADFLCVDWQSLTPTVRAEIPQGFAGGTALVARQIDSWEDHKAARGLGFRHFQGGFFLQPQTFRRREISGTRLSALRLLRAVVKDPLDLSEVESVVRGEPALTYKLLRYLNSPAMERPVEVRSIGNAVALLGDQEFRRWASLVAVATPAADKTGELLRTALTRAYFCEQIALRCDARASYDYYFTGLFSVMDAVLDRPLEEIVRELALPERVRAALLGQPGVLHDALSAARAYERAEWSGLAAAMAGVSLPESCAADCFAAAHSTAAAILHQ